MASCSDFGSKNEVCLFVYENDKLSLLCAQLKNALSGSYTGFQSKYFQRSFVQTEMEMFAHTSSDAAQGRISLSAAKINTWLSFRFLTYCGAFATYFF